MNWTHHSWFKLLQFLQFFQLNLKLLLFTATVFELCVLLLQSLVFNLQKLFGLLLFEAHLLQHFLHLEQFFLERLLLLGILFQRGWNWTRRRLRNLSGDNVDLVCWWDFLLQGLSAPPPLCGYRNNCVTHRWSKRTAFKSFFLKNCSKQWVYFGQWTRSYVG